MSHGTMRTVTSHVPRIRTWLPSALLLVVLFVMISPAGLVLRPAASTQASEPSPFAGAPVPVHSGAASLAAASESLSRGLGPAGGQAWACGSTSPTETARCAPAPPTSPRVAAGGNWAPLGFAPTRGLMAYDAADRYVVLLEPLPAAGGVRTWTFSSGQWSLLGLTSQPGSCPGASMAYDAADSEIVYLGGHNCSSGNQTWTFSLGTWTKLNLATSPGGRFYTAMAYDPARRGVILSGGGTCPTVGCAGLGGLGGTWRFSAGTWSNISATVAGAPPKSEGWSMAYDGVDGFLLLFGRNTTSGQVETWTLNSTSWTHLATTGAPPAGAADFALPMAFDPNLHRVVLFGASSGSAGSNTTWEFSLGVWQNATPARAPVAGSWSLVFDVADNESLLFGTPASRNLWLDGHGDLWTSARGLWTDATKGFGPPASSGASLAYEAADQYVLWFGGCPYFGLHSNYFHCLNQTWAYRNGAWTNVTRNPAPQGRFGQGMVYDAAGGFVLMFGGRGLSGSSSANSSEVLLSDTWEWLNGSWARLSPANHPPAGTGSSIVYDGADGYVLLLCDLGGPTYTWAFSVGNWTNLSGSVTNAPPHPSASLAYDAADGSVVLFGLDTPVAPYHSNATWQFRGGHWTNLSATPGVTDAPPALAAGSPMAYDPSLGRIVLYCLRAELGGAPCSATNPGEVYEYAAEAWTLVLPSNQPPPQSQPRVAYDGFDGYVLMVGGSNQTGSMPDTWAFGGSGGATPLKVQSFIASNEPDDVGVPTTLQAQVVGGVAPFTFVYSGLPAGCGSPNATTVDCTPSFAGRYSIQVTVTDSNGSRVAAQLTLDVFADPNVVSFSASPASLVLGNRTVLTAAVAGGLGTLIYYYAGLPPGCTNESLPDLPCTPTRAGTYTPSVKVSDGLWTSAAGLAPLTVGCAGAAPGPEICAFQASPSALILGNSTTISVSTNAPGSLTYLYTGLPPGCASIAGSTFSCTPTAAGVFDLTVTVTDSQSRAVSVSTGLTVYPVGGGAALQIAAFTAAPSVVSLGNSTVLELVTVGTASSLTYRYSGLPPGCPSANVAALPCTPSTAGTYHTRAVVSDGQGNSAGASLTIEVILPAVLAFPLISVFVATPSIVPLGANLTLVVSLSRGTPPYLYHYVDLPPGCSSADTPTLVCAPSQTGHFNVSVTVFDPNGHNASATTLVVVKPAGSGGPIGLSPTDLFSSPLAQGLAFIAGAILVGGLLETYRRRRQVRREGDEIVRTLTEEKRTGETANDPP